MPRVSRQKRAGPHFPSCPVLDRRLRWAGEWGKWGHISSRCKVSPFSRTEIWTSLISFIHYPLCAIHPLHSENPHVNISPPGILSSAQKEYRFLSLHQMYFKHLPWARLHKSEQNHSGSLPRVLLFWLLSCVRLFSNPMGYSPPGFSVSGIPQARNWSGLPFPSPGGLPNPGVDHHTESLPRN